MQMLRTLQPLDNLAFFSFLFVLFSWSLPVQADTKIDPQLEQQVLQIIRQHPEIILESVQVYQEQQQQKLEKVRQQFVDNFQANPQGAIGDSPVIGGTELKTVVIEFSDFQCPYCAQAHKKIQQLLAKYPHQLTLVYKFFPLTQIHPQALASAKAAWAAGKQGQFWAYHDALFTHQKQLGEPLYLDIAKNLKLDLVKFNRDRILSVKAIEKDLNLANELQVSGTPYFLIKSPDYSGPVELQKVEEILQHER